MMWELKLKSIVMLTNVIEGASRMVSSLDIQSVDWLNRPSLADKMSSILAGIR